MNLGHKQKMTFLKYWNGLITDCWQLILIHFFYGIQLFSNELPLYSSLSICLDQNKSFNINRTFDIKYLGTVIDSHLRWNKYIDYNIQKPKSLTYLFSFYKSVLTVHEMKILYYSLIQSHLNYGLLAWEGATNRYLKKSELSQKWITKIMYKEDYIYLSEVYFKNSKF